MAGTWKLHHDASGVYTSLIPGFSPPGVFEHFQYANTAAEDLGDFTMCGDARWHQAGRRYSRVREGPCQRSQVNIDHSAGYRQRAVLILPCESFDLPTFVLN